MAISRLKAVAKTVYGRVMARPQIAAYLAQSGARQLNLGCGHNVLPGWLNVDLEGGRHGKTFMNALRPFPLPDASIDAILCEHLIEHVPAEGGVFLLKEAFRVLKPGGAIRVITPDLEGLARMCVQAPNDAERRYLDFVAQLHKRPSIEPSDALNYIFYEYGHRHIYTVARLRAVLDEAGFKNISESRAGQPSNPVFVGAEGHPAFMGAENDAIEAFALEAVKPER